MRIHAVRASLRLVPVALVLGGCAIEVADRTGDLVYDPPLNRQTFAADVVSQPRVDGVSVEIVDGPAAPLARSGTARWSGEVPLPACAGTVGYRYAVATPDLFSSRPRVRRFPDRGNFVREVKERPADCASFPTSFRQTFLVDTFVDLTDDRPGDGVCRRGPRDARCALRAAVMEANARGGGDLIRLPPGRYVLTRTEAAADEADADASVGDLDITAAFAIETARPAAERLPFTDILRLPGAPYVDDGPDLFRDDPASDGRVAKIDGGRAMRPLQVHASAGGADGAAVGLRDLVVVNGRSVGQGGGIDNAGVLVLERVAVVENRAGGRRGGGIHNTGVLAATDVVLAQNDIDGLNPTGGALFNGSGAEARLTRAVLAKNRGRFGGSIASVAAEGEVPGTVTVENGTLFDEMSLSGTIAAVQAQTGRVVLHHVTLAQNRPSERNRAILNGSLGGEVRLRNVLIADNGVDQPCRGRIVTEGGNAIDRPCPLTGSPLTPDLVGAAVTTRQQLADLGGLLPVYVLWPTSTAIDLGLALGGPLTDQRGPGFARSVPGPGADEALPDAGAYEQGAGRRDPR